MSTNESADRETAASSGNVLAAAVDSSSLSPADRVPPTWTESFPRKVSRLVGGPLGRHAQVGRQWFWTPLRVILLLAVVTLAAAWLFKVPCQITYDTGSGPQLDWRNSKQYTAMCYTDIIPRYGMGDLAPDDAFPYKTGWVENRGTPQEQVRYMEYPVITGIYQYLSMTLAKTYTAVTKLVSVPVIAVPTSVGYGASFGGIAALLGMLNSCASNVTVVNIDNGYGAAVVASLINRL